MWPELKLVASCAGSNEAGSVGPEWVKKSLSVGKRRTRASGIYGSKYPASNKFFVYPKTFVIFAKKEKMFWLKCQVSCILKKFEIRFLVVK